MDALHGQRFGAWRMHESKNDALIRSVKQAGLECSLSIRGGRTAGQQLVHVQNVRLI